MDYCGWTAKHSTFARLGLDHIQLSNISFSVLEPEGHRSCGQEQPGLLLNPQEGRMDPEQSRFSGSLPHLQKEDGSITISPLLLEREVLQFGLRFY